MRAREGREHRAGDPDRAAAGDLPLLPRQLRPRPCRLPRRRSAGARPVSGDEALADEASWNAWLQTAEAAIGGTWYSVMVAEGDARSVQIAGDAKAFVGDEPCDGAVLQPLVPGRARSLVQCVPPLVDYESRAPFSPGEVTAEALTAVLAGDRPTAPSVRRRRRTSRLRPGDRRSRQLTGLGPRARPHPHLLPGRVNPPSTSSSHPCSTSSPALASTSNIR